MDVDYSCYEGREVQGGADVVLSRGKVIVDGEQWLGKAGDGRFVKRAAELVPALAGQGCQAAIRRFASGCRGASRPASRAAGHALWPARCGHFGRGQSRRRLPRMAACVQAVAARRRPDRGSRTMTVDASVGREPDPFLPLPLLTPIRRPDRGGALPVLLRRAVHAARAPRASTSRRSSARSRPATSRAAPARSSPPTRWAPPAAPRAPSSACARAPACESASTARSRSAGCSATPSRRPRLTGGHVLHRPAEDAGVSAAIVGAGPAGPRLRRRAAQGRASA